MFCAHKNLVFTSTIVSNVGVKLLRYSFGRREKKYTKTFLTVHKNSFIKVKFVLRTVCAESDNQLWNQNVIKVMINQNWK